MKSKHSALGIEISGGVKNLNDFFQMERSSDLKEATESVNEGIFSLWPYFRVYYAESLVLKKKAGVKLRKSIIGVLIKDLFYGNPLNIFRRPSYLAYVASDQRKEINGNYVHPLDLLPCDISREMLMIELPFNRKNKYCQTASRYVLSAYILIILENIVGFFLIGKKTRYKKEYDEIEDLLNTSFNRLYQTKRFYSSYYLTKFMLKFWSKPKMVFCCAPYPFMGRIVALKEAGIPIVEIQHGYVGSSHRAYNIPRNYGSIYYPDFFLSWGEYEKNFFGNENNFYLEGEDCVFPVGNFYIDHLLQKSTTKEKEKIRHHLPAGNYLVAVALQDPLEDELMPFIIESALNDDEFTYLLLPRVMPHQYYRDKYNLPLNVFLLEDINTYEGIMAADFHTTIWSTTAIEAVMFGKANVLINPNGISKSVLGDLLNDKTNTYYVETPEEMATKLHEISRQPAKEKLAVDLFHRNGVEANIAQAIKRITEATDAFVAS